MEKPKYLFVIRKYIMAESALDAIRLDMTKPVDDVYVDGDWRQEHMIKGTPPGFKEKPTE